MFFGQPGRFLLPFLQLRAAFLVPRRCAVPRALGRFILALRLFDLLFGCRQKCIELRDLIAQRRRFLHGFQQFHAQRAEPRFFGLDVFLAGARPALERGNLSCDGFRVAPQLVQNLRRLLALLPQRFQPFLQPGFLSPCFLCARF